MANKPYVLHACKNHNCNEGWLDIDEYNAKVKPPKWRYCPTCKAKGYSDSKDPQKVERMKQVRSYLKIKLLNNPKKSVRYET